MWATEVGEEYDGGKYHEALCSTLTHIFEIRNDQLLLYYSEGQNYLLFNNVTCAQYLPILEDDKQWVINRSVADLDNNITLVVSGDSVLNGVHYTVIGNELLREEGAKVYVYDNFFQAEKVLYDFSLSVGDIAYNDLEEEIRLYVVCVDTIEVNGVSRKRIVFFTGSQLEYYGDKLDPTNPNQWANCWVEGIGGIYGLTDTYGWYIIGSRTIMQQCFVNNECVFTYDDFFTKPVSNISAITNIIDKSHEIYDLQGRKVTTPQRNRLYIKNGKKFVGN